jgi:hypothetical protein
MKSWLPKKLSWDSLATWSNIVESFWPYNDINDSFGPTVTSRIDSRIVGIFLSRVWSEDDVMKGVLRQSSINTETASANLAPASASHLISLSKWETQFQFPHFTRNNQVNFYICAFIMRTYAFLASLFASGALGQSVLADCFRSGSPEWKDCESIAPDRYSATILCTNTN